MHEIRIHRPTAVAFGTVLGLAHLCLSTQAAYAQQATLNVNAMVAQACQLTVPASGLDFGTYVQIQPTPKNSSMKFTYNCSAGLNITISMDGNPSARAMNKMGGQILLYSIHRDAARTQLWGANGDGLTISPTPGGLREVDVYGQIPAEQGSETGAYTDVVQVTLVVN